MTEREKKTMIAIGVLVLCALLYFAYGQRLPQLLAVFESNHDEEQIEAYLRNQNRFFGMFCLGILQIIQVISILIPGAPIQIAGGLVYGALRSFIVCHLTFVGANVLVFVLARNPRTPLGRIKLLNGDKMHKVQAWLNSNEPAMMTLMAYMMPGVPNGMVPYAAAKISITLRQFFIAVYWGSFFPILMMCALGNELMNGNYLLSVLMCVGLLLCILLMYRYKSDILGLYRRTRAWLRTQKQAWHSKHTAEKSSNK